MRFFSKMVDTSVAAKRRVSVETLLAVTSGILALTTSVAPDWVEQFMGSHADGGDSSVERLAAFGFTVALLIVACPVRAAPDPRSPLSEPGLPQWSVCGASTLASES
jgi:hypothetical protein